MYVQYVCRDVLYVCLMYVCMYVVVCSGIGVCMYVCMYVCRDVLYVCMYVVEVYVCMYVCGRGVCMYVWVVYFSGLCFAGIRWSSTSTRQRFSQVRLRHPDSVGNVCMYVCVNVCMYVCLCGLGPGSIIICLLIGVCAYTILPFQWVSVCMYVSMYVCMYVCMCMYVCTYCMYVCIAYKYVCMYVWLCINECLYQFQFLDLGADIIVYGFLPALLFNETMNLKW